MIRVLLVDDHAVVRMGFRLLLQTTAEISVIGEADCGEEGVAAADRLEPQLVLLDVRMPAMDGLELQRRLGEIHRLIPIIFLSARASEEEERRALRAGAADFLRKPVSKEALLHAIRAVLDIPVN